MQKMSVNWLTEFGIFRLYSFVGLKWLFSREAKMVTEEITQLLMAWNRGDASARDALMPLIYDELRRLARSYLRRERMGHTLQPTALVHEAFLRLIDQSQVNWQSRAHFFGIAARLMRQVLINHAEARQAAKRGGSAERISLNDLEFSPVEEEVDLMALNEALKNLESQDPPQGQIVELRFFSGLTIEEIAEVMRISPATVKREWSTARAWLRRELSR
jgi:RNA polymerase sigma factor (TIGR02999 family)